MRQLRIPEKSALGVDIEATVGRSKAGGRVLRRIAGVELRRGAAVQVEGIARQARQQVEAGLKHRDEIAGRALQCKDVAVERFVDLAVREPEEVAHPQPDRIVVWPRPLGYGLAGIGRLSRCGGRLRSDRNRWQRQQGLG